MPMCTIIHVLFYGAANDSRLCRKNVILVCGVWLVAVTYLVYIYSVLMSIIDLF